MKSTFSNQYSMGKTPGDATYSVGRCVEIWAPVGIFG